MSLEERRTTEIVKTPEVIDPHSIAVVTTTSYPDWVKGGESGSVTQARGDAIIDMAKAAKEKGCQMVVVDGNGKFASPQVFRDELQGLGVKVLEQVEPGMAASRRQVIKAGSELSDAKVIIWSEEKPSIFEDNSPETLVGPIARDEADIIIFDRGEEGMASYNPQQAAWENKANSDVDKILVHQGLKPEGSPQLDLWSGPRAIRNTPQLVEMFMQVYEFRKVVDPDRPRATEMHKRINPERWFDSIFRPVVEAMDKGYRVVSQPIHYKHRQSMNESEKENEEMANKRETQYIDLVHQITHYIHYLKGKNVSRIYPATR